MCYKKCARPKELSGSQKLPTPTDIEHALFLAYESETNKSFKPFLRVKPSYYRLSFCDFVGCTNYCSIVISFQINQIIFRYSLINQVEEKKLMKPQALNVIKMLSKPISERMPFQGVQLTKFTQKIPFFKQYFSVHQQSFVSMCLSSQLLQCPQGDNIYDYQQRPDNIYIIIDGTVQITPNNCVDDHKQSKIMTNHSLLGNVQVVFRLDKREQKAVALSQVYCMVISYDNFNEIWKKGEQIQKAYNYLKKNPYFEYLSAYQRKKLSLIMHKKPFKVKEIIRKQGDNNENIIFIIYGQLQAIKSLTFNNGVKDVIIQTLEQMSSYGQYQVTYDQPNQVSLIANQPGTYYSIPIRQFSESNQFITKIIKNNAVPYPDKEELEFRLRIQTDMQKQKDRVKKNLFHGINY